MPLSVIAAKPEPPIGALSHWRLGTGVPTAAAVKVAFWPIVAVTLVGEVVNVGVSGAVEAVSVKFCVMLPLEFVAEITKK